MPIIKIFQGLGNQFFQYALARSLEERHQISCRLDVSWFKENSKHRAFGLDRFNTKYVVASEEEIYNVKNGIFADRLRNFFFQRTLYLKPYYKQPYFLENLRIYDPNIVKINSRTYVEGYFSSELFFKEIRTILVKELTLRAQPNQRNKELMSRMADEPSVCLSVRRGDFVNHPLHDVCGLDYFQEGIAYFKKLLKDPVFYIFSDDNEWVRDHLKISEKHHFITHNYPDYYEDFRLMQCCKHHLIPNSTFSWWAAWISNHPEKKVVAPKIWLKTDEIDYSYFLPDEWVKIDNFKL
jgi:hypothetical protein